MVAVRTAAGPPVRVWIEDPGDEVQQNQQRVPCTLVIPGGEEYTLSAMVETEVKGLIGLEDDVLVLQLQETRTRTSMTSMAVKAEASPVVDLRIPLSRLASVASRGWWGRRVTLRANDLTLFEAVPGVPGDHVRLKFRRRDRHGIDELVTRLQFALSDLGLARLDDRIRQLEGGAGTALPGAAAPETGAEGEGPGEERDGARDGEGAHGRDGGT